MINDVAAAALTAPSLKSYPFPEEDTVLAPFDGAYCRALVLSCDENAGQVHVGYIDYGDEQVVAFSALKAMPTELKEQPRLPLFVILKNWVGEPAPNELIAMKKYLVQISESSQVLKIKSEHYAHITANDVVELFDAISNRSVNKHLKSMIQKRYYLSDFLHKKLEIDPANLLTLFAFNTPRIGDKTMMMMMTCLVDKDIAQFLRDDERTQQFGNAVECEPAYKPKQKEVCVVRIDDKAEGNFWYRCVYQTELVNDRAQVYCIDFDRFYNVRANVIRFLTI